MDKVDWYTTVVDAVEERKGVISRQVVIAAIEALVARNLLSYVDAIKLFFYFRRINGPIITKNKNQVCNVQSARIVEFTSIRWGKVGLQSETDIIDTQVKKDERGRKVEEMEVFFVNQGKNLS